MQFAHHLIYGEPGMQQFEHVHYSIARSVPTFFIHLDHYSISMNKISKYLVYMRGPEATFLQKHSTKNFTRRIENKVKMRKK